MSDIVRDPYGNPLNRDKLITTLTAEVEDAHRRESCAADLAREWEHHCKTAEAENEKLRAALWEILNKPRDANKTYTELFVEVCLEIRAALEEKP